MVTRTTSTAGTGGVGKASLHALGALLLAACGAEALEAEAWTPQQPVARCGTGSGALPPGLLELAYDSGVAFSDVSQQSWSVGGEQLSEAVLHEAVRFDLEQPAQIHGFSVQWAGLPSPHEPMAEVHAGLYPDLGHNGFDFWPVPLWRGSRCRGELEEGSWATYVFAEPLLIDHPGLVYVAHRRDGPGTPAFLFDDAYAPDGDCSAFATCHSAMNLPEADLDQYYNGVSFPFPYNFMVRLHLRYTDRVLSEETFFQPLPTPPIGRWQSFGDVDNDGDDDLLTGARLLRNDGGSFVDASAAAGLRGATITGGVFGDYDNDGCLDLLAFVAATSAGETLWRGNCDGSFVEVTAAAGIVDLHDYTVCGDDPERVHWPTPAAAWLDIDGDGWLDLYVANYYCGAVETYLSDQVWHNERDGTFTEWSGQHGFVADALASRGAAPIDVEQDGDVDLLVNTYRLQRNLFFENQGNGRVVETARSCGLAGERTLVGLSSAYGHSIGVAWGDLDNDGDFDLVEANLAHPRFFHFSDKTRVLLNDGGGRFTDIAGDWETPESAAGLRYQETHSVPVLGDFDHDGVLDLAISATYDGRPTDFYWGRGDGTFALDALHAGITVTDGWGMALADIDLDGDLDLAARGALLENVRDDPGHWLQVRPVGTERCNRGAYGATVRVAAGGVTRLRHVQGGSGQGDQDSAYLHFGLGEASTVDAIEVDFPGAGTVRFDGPLQADRRLWLYEDGDVYAGWAPP